MSRETFLTIFVSILYYTKYYFKHIKCSLDFLSEYSWQIQALCKALS